MWYDKKKINSSFSKYCDTEDPDDYGKFLTALEPMIRGIAKKWYTLERHREDVIQEMFLTLWHHQSDINRMKLLRLKFNNNGNGFCISTHFHFIIRGYMGKIGPRLDRIFEDDLNYLCWFMMHEEWMGNIDIDEGTKMFERGA